MSVCFDCSFPWKGLPIFLIILISTSTLVFLVGAAAILCSVYAALSCEFLYYTMKNGASNPQPPFNTLPSSYVGFFGYTGPEHIKCIKYKDTFFKSTFGQFFQTAMICAVVAPALATLAWFVNLVECCFCKMACSNLVSSMCFQTAMVLQGLTFIVYAERDFWYVLCVTERMCIRFVVRFLFCQDAHLCVCFISSSPFQQGQGQGLQTKNWRHTLYSCYGRIFSLLCFPVLHTKKYTTVPWWKEEG